MSHLLLLVTFSLPSLSETPFGVHLTISFSLLTRSASVAALTRCIEEDRLQLRHETSPEFVPVLQAGLLLKEHHKRGISGEPTVIYHTASTYKRSGT